MSTFALRHSKDGKTAFVTRKTASERTTKPTQARTWRTRQRAQASARRRQEEWGGRFEVVPAPEK